MSSVNHAEEIQLKILNERVLSTGESCTSEYVTFLQSYERGTLSIHWYVAQSFWSIILMSVLFRISFEAEMFSIFIKGAMPTSIFMKEVYNGRFAPEFNVSLLKEILALV